MGIKAVHYVEVLSQLRGLNRKIGCASATENHDINLILPLRSILCGTYLYTLGEDLYAIRITSRKYCL